jgi:hypothetical protein
MRDYYFKKRKNISWPNGKSFAFSIFDDTDMATIENVGPVYNFLETAGFRTTKSVWPLRGNLNPAMGGDTCENPIYLDWLKELHRQGFEIGLHLATFHTSPREQTWAGLKKFRQLFGHWPLTLAMHVGCDEGIYWGDRRLSGVRRFIYNILTKFNNRNRYHGHIHGDPLYWGDLCKQYITYVRNFVYGDINTLNICPYMPYHDKKRPYVNWWFASSEGSTVDSFTSTISEENQDRLEAEGGACIMYTHFAYGFHRNGRLNQRFEGLMRRLSKKNGWFVPVSVLLDYLREKNGDHIITYGERMALELRWLLHKFRVGKTS